MASCWKVSWNVDPLALSVPLRAALPGEDGPPPGADEEHAARARAVAATAAPAVVTCCLRGSRISGTPYGVHVLPGRAKQSRTADHLAIPGARVRSGGTGNACEQAHGAFRQARWHADAWPRSGSRRSRRRG